jgi:hypothetical protein
MSQEVRRGILLLELRICTNSDRTFGNFDAAEIEMAQTANGPSTNDARRRFFQLSTSV